MTYVKVSVAKSGTNPGIGGNKKDTIVVFDMDDVLTYPSRDSKGITITDNIVFKPNAYMITLYGTPSSIKANSDGEGDPDAKAFIQTIAFDHPGDQVAIREFKTNWINRNVGIIIQRCTSTAKNLYGSPCAPLQMTTKSEDDNDKNKSTFEFKSILRGPEIADYQGTLTFDTVTDTVAADETSVDVANGEGRYQLTDGSASAATITTMDNAADGSVYTILGSGGSYPSVIPAGNDFVLANGVTWTAIADATLTVKAMKTGTSPVSWVFIELSRS